MYTLRHTTGYTLVEALVAISILMLAVAGPLTIASKGLQSSYYARDQLAATMLAQEAIEILTAIRNERALAVVKANGNLNYSNLWSWSAHGATSDPLYYCFQATGCNIDAIDSSLTTGNVVSCSPATNCVIEKNPSPANSDRIVFRRDQNTGSVTNNTPFSRVVRMTDIVPNREIRVEVTVSWYPTVFGSGRKDVVLVTELYNVYGR